MLPTTRLVRTSYPIRFIAVLVTYVGCRAPAAGAIEDDAGAIGDAGVVHADAGTVASPRDAAMGTDGNTGGSAPTGSDAAVGAESGAPGTGDAGGALPLPSPLHGVTVDDISNLTQVVASLSALPPKPTARIVFDESEQPSYYAQAVPAVHDVAYVMGEILDSEYVATYSVAEYTQRTSDYLAAMPTGVDLWEVGNEINGNWLGAESDVVAKMTGAFDLVKAAGGKTELTLYGCSDSGQTYDMVTWTQANVPARMLTGLDYVLVSYYEGDCGAPRSDWASAFQQLRALFPTAGLGFGEVGYVDANGNDLALQNESAAAAYLQKYYSMQIAVPGYVGGYFWWYFAEDMVPKTQPLFPVLSAAMQ